MNPLSVIPSIWGYVIAAIAGAILAGYVSYHFTALSYSHQLDELKLQQAQAQGASIQASLTKLQNFISQMNAAGVDYAAATQQLDEKLNSLQKEFHNAISTKPLPPDCRPDAVRERVFYEAIDSTNAIINPPTTGGFGSTMRGADTSLTR